MTKSSNNLRIPYLIILFLFCGSIHAQDYIQKFDETDPWMGQATHDFQVLSEFKKYCIDNSILSAPFSMLEMNKKDPISYMKVVDLNNDGNMDIVYSGPSGGEPSIVNLYVKTSNGYKEVFSEMQGIERVEWKDNLLSKIFIEDWGCCADPQIIQSVFDVSYTGGVPQFTKTYQSIELDELTKPKNYFNKPVRFIVDNEQYNIRFQPLIDNETDFQWMGLTGNTFAILGKGATGTAYSSKEDETGRIWWYVSIDPSDKIISSEIKSRDGFPTHLVGWISSRYVKEISE